MIGLHPSLPFLTILIKKLLAANDWNKVFQGGVGSYAVVLISLAFINLENNALKNIG